MKAVCFAHEAKPRPLSRCRGFTLFELMIAVAVIAVIAGFAVPSFMTTLRANRLVTDNNAIVSALALARSEAIRRGTRVTVCRTADQAACANAGGWEQGWMVFVDPTGQGTVDAGEEILRVWDARDGGTTIRPDAAFAGFVSFVGSGETRGNVGNSGAFRVCSDNASTIESRTISVGLIGYASTQKGTSACP